MVNETSLTQGAIETETGPISVLDLSYFLYLFRAVYVEALYAKKNLRTQVNLSEGDIESLAMIVARLLASKGRDAIANNASAQLSPDEDLAIADISRRNPLDVVFSSVSIALAIAVVISGGEIKLGSNELKVKLPPLGKGIAEIRKAINGDYEPKHPKEDKPPPEGDKQIPEDDDPIPS